MDGAARLWGPFATRIAESFPQKKDDLSATDLKQCRRIESETNLFSNIACLVREHETNEERSENDRERA